MQIKQEREREKVLNIPLNSHEIQSQSCHVQLKMNTGIFTSSSAGSFREASVLTSCTLSDFRLLACQITCHIVKIGKGQVASSLEGDSPLHPFHARVHQSVPANRIHDYLWLDLLTHWIVWNISKWYFVPSAAWISSCLIAKKTRQQATVFHSLSKLPAATSWVHWLKLTLWHHRM